FSFVSPHIPPRPSSTLFPYTTLFRSIRPYEVCRMRTELEALGGDVGVIAGRVGEHVVGHDAQRQRNQRCPPARPAVATKGDQCRDRKSTRLNSSHLGISYAVFCLKKK